ncbi:hypothetical protein Tco_1227785, partial [Tanacetum coccineum]
VYLQQFWKTVHKVPKTNDTIRFKLYTQEITHTLDMFRDTLKLLVETLDNSFVVPATVEIIKSFMNRVGYQGVVDKVSAFFTKNLAQPWQTMFKVFNRCLTIQTSGHDHTKINILQLFHAMINRTNVDYVVILWWDFIYCVQQKKNVIQHDEDYYSIKDDTPVVSVYSIGNVLFRGMRTPDAFLTVEIHATDDYKEYETVFVGVDVPMNQPQPVVSTQGTHRITPKAHRTPTLTTVSPQGKKRQQAAEAQENVAKVQEKLVEEEIKKMVEGEEDEESYASEFADSMLNDDVDDFGTRIEPASYKENPYVVADDDVSKKKDDEKDEDDVNDDDVEKTDDAGEENDNDDHTDHTLIGTYATGNMETRNKQMKYCWHVQTTWSNSLPHQKKIITHEFFMRKIREVLDHCNKVVPEMTFAKTNEMIKEEMPRLVKLAIDKDREVTPISNTTLNLYPTTSSLTVEKSTADLQQQLYLNMKTKPQDQATIQNCGKF